MKKDIELLIKHLEEEKQNLEKGINDCLIEWDYESAQHFVKGLRLINQKLQILAELDNSNKLKIKHKKSTLEKLKQNFEKKIDQKLKKETETKMDPFMIERSKKHRSRMIDAKIKEIENLDKETIRLYKDDQIIDDTIYKLLDFKISSFKINLKRKHNFYIKFKMNSKEELIISFTKQEKLKFKYWLDDIYLDQLKKLGFNSINDSIELSYNMINFKSIIKLKELLARIFFEIYFFTGLDKEITIELRK